MKKIQNFYLYSYRLIGFIFLSGLIASIIGYGFSMLFFIANSSWSVPMILSPNQEKVMAHLEHVLVFEHEVTKNKSEILALEQLLHHKKTLLDTNQHLLERLNKSMKQESILNIKANKMYTQLIKEKKITVNQLHKLTAAVSNEEQLIDKELELGLITKQEALQAHLRQNKISSNLVDSKAGLYDLKIKARDYLNSAQTLNGSENNLRSMNKVIKKVDLEGSILQFKSDIFSLETTLSELNKNIEKKTKVLHSMKKSPYILATKKALSVAFVPYQNLKHLKIGAPIFSCYLDMILCYKSGRVTEIYNAEEYAKHPVFKSDIKGQLIGIHFDYEPDAQKKIIFLNSKPLIV